MRRARRLVAAVAGGAVALGSMSMGALPSVAFDTAPIGQNFTLNASDLRFILKQIKIAENHAGTPADPANPCAGLLGSGPNQIPNNGVGVAQPLGLRTVDGSCNNLVTGQRDYGTADRVFPRLVAKNLTGAESFDPDGPGPAPRQATSYTQTQGTVVDSGPRVISNLIVDQTAKNPAAVAAAGEDPAVTPSGAFFIPNVATDVGLSAPYNSWFTLFGQFFDHGLDLVGKGGNGSVFMPLHPDDPQYVQGSPTNFMVLTRATHSGDHEATNQTSPFVDQSQTYTSHPSHQVFLREYEADPVTGAPVRTGAMLTGPGGGMADWTAVKTQARTLFGIELTDVDVTRVPLLATDQYGHFLPGANGNPQLVTSTGLVEGDRAAPVQASTATATGHAFLDDIAHHAVPTRDHDRSPATPDLHNTPDAEPGTTDDGLSTTYDDEMLGRHYVAGDGRVNENIGLIAVHHVFHSEHNRLREDIDTKIGTLLSATEQADWRATNRPGGWDYGDRLFQAARFVAEMEYQHLAFEEFIRKVQPMVNLFGEGGTGYHTEIDPAISAEFAHAVYRFGHSMLTESVDRVRADKSRDDIALLAAFLNPPAFQAGYATPDEAAGAVVRGMTRQVGNELDEFVTDALRDELLGLPLDLAALNLARARDTGVPTLNAARKKFFAVSSDSALEPYTSWADFGLSIKHAESLPNFIAAYGRHPGLLAAQGMAAKRDVANAIVYGAAGPDGVLENVPNAPRPEVDETADNPRAAVPVDSYAFLNSTTYETVDDAGTGTTHSEWVSGAGGASRTGVDAIDLWVGGLAEKQMVFGGLLGSTFNYVFETQAESLQDGDRFYYLSRTAGLNLLTQLEGNSFAELIQRNTDASSLPADSFSRPDLVFDVARLGTSGPITDDADTTDNETTLLSREPDGTIRYAGPLHAVFNGTAGNDRIRSSEGDDTIRGNDGNDRMEGGDGADNLVGGLGDDILTDLFGDDTLKGGDGDDVLSSGKGFAGDLNQGGTGNDLIIGGNDTTETFAGEGNDVVYAGDAEDTVFGDGGDDWIEGGKGPFNLLQGDNGAPFQDDPNEAGHDVIFGFGGETDNDAEGGDDIMFAGSLIQRNEGMAGHDWVTYKGMEPNPQPADADLGMTQFVPPDAPSDVNRDRFDLVESVSGWDLDDTLIGDDRTAADLGTEHGLNAAGIARINGLAGLLPAGATSFDAGNIILGGGGSDLLTGLAGNDILDGDAWLDAELEAPVPGTTGTRRVPAMKWKPAGDNPPQSLAEQAVAGLVDPGDITIVRTIRPGTPGTGVDVATFSGPRADYDLVQGANGLQVVHTRGTALDGTDTVRNVEQLRFSDVTVPATIPVNPAPTVATRVPAAGATGQAVGASVTATFSEAVTGVNGATFTLRAAGSTTNVAGTVNPGTTASQWILDPTTNLANGVTYTATLTGGAAAIRDLAGAPLATTSWTFTTIAAPNPAPTVTTRTPATGATGVSQSGDLTATFSEGVTGVTTGTFTVRPTSAGTTSAPIPATVTRNGTTNQWVLNPTDNLPADTSYTVRLTGGSTSIRDLAGAPLTSTSWSFRTGPVPTVTGQAPAFGATGVSQSGNLSATFSEAVDGVTATTFTLRLASASPTSTPIEAVVSRNGTTNQWILDPAATLTADTLYTVRLTGGATSIRDLGGNPLVSTSWSFRTGPAPTVTARTPGVGSTGVSRTANATATFSETLAAAPTTANVTLRLGTASTGTLVASAVTYNATTRVVTLNPDATLAASTLYTVRLSNGIRDSAGNALAPVTWSFTTGP